MDRREFVKMLSLAGVAASGSLVLGCRSEGEAPAPAATATTATASASPTATPTPTPTPKPLASLDVKGPPSHLTILFQQATEDARLKALVPSLSVSTWRNPDELRAGLVSGQLPVAGAPTYVGANLYRKGVPVQLLNVGVWGVLWLFANGAEVKGWGDLRGRKILIPFKGDMPDLVFQFLARSNGLTVADLDIQYTSAPAEAMQLLVAGRGNVAVLSEPAATGAEVQAKARNLPIQRVMDLQQEWAKATGGKPRIPQAGTLVTRAFAQEHGEVMRALHQAMADSVARIAAGPAAAATASSKLLGMEAPVVERSLATTQLEVVSAQAAKAELEAFFSKLKELSPDIIGGDLPDAGFYVA